MEKAVCRQVTWLPVASLNMCQEQEGRPGKLSVPHSLGWCGSFPACLYGSISN